MTRIRLVAAALLAGTLLVPMAAVGATTVDECTAQIETLSGQTGDITTFRSEKDQVGLVGRLADAAAKLDQGKPADAVAKLNQFTDKVNVLAATGKLAPADAQRLVSGATDAISCISMLGA